MSDYQIFISGYRNIGKHLYRELEKFNPSIYDERMGDSHTFVYEDHPYYDSHCLNKDIPALIKFADNPPLITKMDEINSGKKKAGRSVE